MGECQNWNAIMTGRWDAGMPIPECHNDRAPGRDAMAAWANERTGELGTTHDSANLLSPQFNRNVVMVRG